MKRHHPVPRRALLAVTACLSFLGFTSVSSPARAVPQASATYISGDEVYPACAAPSEYTVLESKLPAPSSGYSTACSSTCSTATTNLCSDSIASCPLVYAVQNTTNHTSTLFNDLTAVTSTGASLGSVVDTTFLNIRANRGKPDAQGIYTVSAFTAGAKTRPGAPEDSELDATLSSRQIEINNTQIVPPGFNSYQHWLETQQYCRPGGEGAGKYDGANCWVMAPIPANAWVYTPAGTARGLAVYWDAASNGVPRNKCPVGWFGGADNCTVGNAPAGAWGMRVENGQFRYEIAGNCPAGHTEVGWACPSGGIKICKIADVPYGTPTVNGWTAWYDSNPSWPGFYYKQHFDCGTKYPGSWAEGTACKTAQAPPDTSAFIWVDGSGIRHAYYSKYAGAWKYLQGYAGQNGGGVVDANQFRTPNQIITLYFHGRRMNGSGPIYGWSYSGWSNHQKGANPKWAAWDSTSRIWTGKGQVKAILDNACKGTAYPCRLVGHSAGDLVLKQVIAENPAGTWNIINFTAIQGAGLGSAIADVRNAVPDWLVKIASFFGVTKDIDEDLETNNARYAIDHNLTRGITFYRVATRKDLFVPACKWWWVACNIKAETLSIANAFLDGLHGGGGHDLVLHYQSQIGFNTKAGGNDMCAYSRFQNHVLKNGCNVIPTYWYDDPNDDKGGEEVGYSHLETGDLLNDGDVTWLWSQMY